MHAHTHAQTRTANVSLEGKQCRIIVTSQCVSESCYKSVTKANSNTNKQTSKLVMAHKAEIFNKLVLLSQEIAENVKERFSELDVQEGRRKVEFE